MQENFECRRIIIDIYIHNILQTSLNFIYSFNILLSHYFLFLSHQQHITNLDSLQSI